MVVEFKDVAIVLVFGACTLIPIVRILAKLQIKLAELSHQGNTHELTARIEALEREVHARALIDRDNDRAKL